MKIYKITEASDYLGVSINTLKTLANNGKIKSFKTTGEHRRFRQDDLMDQRDHEMMDRVEPVIHDEEMCARDEFECLEV